MQRAWIFAVGLLTVSPAAGANCAAEADDEARLACFDRLAECVTQHDPQRRLACYDAASPRHAAAAKAPPAPGRSDVAPAARERRADELFPLPGASKDEARAEEGLAAEVVAVRTDARGLHYLTLDNGQIWRELSKGRIRFEAGDRVEITPGILGSVNLRVEGRSGYVKVRRVE